MTCRWPRGGLGPDGGRDAVRREDQHAAGGHVAQVVGEDCPPPPQPLDDVLVVDDLVADIDRGAEDLQRLFDDLDRPIHAGTEAARAGQ